LKVFSNTTPFIALACINQTAILQKLFGKIHVAESVLAECEEGGKIVVPDLRKLSWIEALPDAENISLPVQFELDQGEKQTIALALKYHADMVIIDERMGRRMAEYFGLHVTGTLGVLAKAKASGLIPSFFDAANGMSEQGIFYNNGLIVRIAKHLGEFPSP